LRNRSPSSASTIVTDEFLGGSGTLDGIKKVLGETGFDYAVFDGALPYPAFDPVQAG
jgi:alcohol dehydrogenase class IV